MRISSLYGLGKPVISLEVFPPKKDDDYHAVYTALTDIAACEPDYISVTCGAAGGGNTNRTMEIAEVIQREHSITSLAHMTCIFSTKQRLHEQLAAMRAQGVENVLALRGDIPPGSADSACGEFAHASDLIREIRASGDFCIGAACYPEGHIDCDNTATDILYLREKQDAGANFFISQLFFDNASFYSFLDKARAAGVTLPISAGIMPILGQKQIERMIFLCGASLPSAIIKLLHKYEHSPADLRKAGIEHAASQAQALLEHGADGVHFYTMNRPDVAQHCLRHIGRL